MMNKLPHVNMKQCLRLVWLTQQILWDAEERDRLLTGLQRNLQDPHQPPPSINHAYNHT